jgi:hypothetical protein
MLSRTPLVALVLLCLCRMFVAAAGATPLRDASPSSIACSSSYVAASLSWGNKCLRAGEFCKIGNSEYHRYGFDCPASGQLVNYSGSSSHSTSAPARGSTAPGSVAIGRTLFIAPRTRASGCKRGTDPDRHCSPGAYYSGLTKAVICSPSFHTSTIRNVPDSEKHQVEIEYGLTPKGYGSTLEIDHIVSLELGGSNDIANLYPEEATFTNHDPGFHVKDKLKNKLHDLVCSGVMSLRAAQRGIAGNWEALYKMVYGTAPAG